MLNGFIILILNFFGQHFDQSGLAQKIDLYFTFRLCLVNSAGQNFSAKSLKLRGLPEPVHLRVNDKWWGCFRVFDDQFKNKPFCYFTKLGTDINIIADIVDAEFEPFEREFNGVGFKLESI